MGHIHVSPAVLTPSVRQRYLHVAIASAIVTASVVCLRGVPPVAAGSKLLANTSTFHPRGGKQRVKVFLLVKTVPAELERRTVMRETWLGALRGHAEVRYRFFCEEPKEDERAALEAEASREEDVVILEALVQRAHRQIGVKMVRSFKWIVENWNVGHVAVLDDDTYVNTASLLADYPSWHSTMFYMGIHVNKQPVIKVANGAIPPGGKYGESPLFPVDVWPRYAAGPFYVLSRDALEPFIRPLAPLREMSSNDAMTGTVLLPYNVDCTQQCDPSPSSHVL
jgi:hypothetical protein